MSGLSQSDTREVAIPGRILLAGLLKGGVDGISHIAIGRLHPAIVSELKNYRNGNNFEMSRNDNNSVTIHNDFPVANTDNNPGTSFDFKYYIDVNNSSIDKVLSTISTPALNSGVYNHIFLIHDHDIDVSTAVGSVSIITSADAVKPSEPAASVVYIGYVKVDSYGKIINVFNNSRMWSEIQRNVPESIQYLNDAFRDTFTNPDVENYISTEPTRTLMIEGRFGTGIEEDVSEVALIGNNGESFLAFTMITTQVLTLGQKLRIRWTIRL